MAFDTCIFKLTFVDCIHISLVLNFNIDAYGSIVRPKKRWIDCEKNDMARTYSM